MNILCFVLSLLLSSAVLAEAASSLSKGSKQVINHDIAWQIGGKIHFEEESGSDYIGTKQINQLLKNQLNNLINIKTDLCSSNAKIMLKKERNEIIMTHYEEECRPGIGEEMHATLLYIQPREFCESETLKQVCPNLLPHAIFLPQSKVLKTIWFNIQVTSHNV